MAVTLKQVEEIPTAYPALEPDQFGQVPDGMIWQRIESYIAHRFTPRGVVWTVEGEGDWTPPLTPATITAAQKWEGGWVDVTIPEGPYGYCLPGNGPYRITATVGPEGVTVGDVLTFPVPDAVARAARRLNQYLLVERTADRDGNPTGGPDHWATTLRINGDGEGAAEKEFQRPATWIAKAMQNSGAADLLRNFRRA